MKNYTYYECARYDIDASATRRIAKIEYYDSWSGDYTGWGYGEKTETYLDRHPDSLERLLHLY